MELMGTAMTDPEGQRPACRFDETTNEQLVRLLQDLRLLYVERNEAMTRLGRAHNEALDLLAVAAQFRSAAISLPMLRVSVLAEALALRLGQSPSFAHLLRRAARVHDVGEVGIPDEVLKKVGPLTADEQRVMNAHAELGAGILGHSRAPLLRMAAEVALTHHERWDGLGHPRGLRGEEIPLSGRIVSVVDCYDALTMDRGGREGVADEVALAMLMEQRGAAFDPQVIDAFMAAAADLVALRARVNAEPEAFELPLEQECRR